MKSSRRSIRNSHRKDSLLAVELKKEWKPQNFSIWKTSSAILDRKPRDYQVKSNHKRKKMQNEKTVTALSPPEDSLFEVKFKINRKDEMFQRNSWAILNEKKKIFSSHSSSRKKSRGQKLFERTPQRLSTKNKEILKWNQILQAVAAKRKDYHHPVDWKETSFTHFLRPQLFTTGFPLFPSPFFSHPFGTRGGELCWFTASSSLVWPSLLHPRWEDSGGGDERMMGYCSVMTADLGSPVLDGKPWRSKEKQKRRQFYLSITLKSEALLKKKICKQNKY